MLQKPMFYTVRRVAPSGLAGQLCELTKEEPGADIVFGADPLGRIIQIALDDVLLFRAVCEVDGSVAQAQQTVARIGLIVHLQSEKIFGQPDSPRQKKSSLTRAATVPIARRAVLQIKRESISDPGHCTGPHECSVVISFAGPIIGRVVAEPKAPIRSDQPRQRV